MLRSAGLQVGRFVWMVAAGCASAFLLAAPVSAESGGNMAESPNPSEYGWREVSSGIDAARDQWLFYSGMTVAPFSRDAYTDGWRLRFGGGYGQYGYTSAGPHTGCGTAWLDDICSEEHRSRRHFKVSHSYAEALLGYYLQLGRVTAKAFAGASMSSEQHLNGFDPSHNHNGIEFGAKGALELWLNVSDRSWSSLDLSYSTARNETSSRWRMGWRAAPAFSLGPELRYDKNVETGDAAWNGRAGLFARYEWTAGEVSLAGGAAWWIDNWSPKYPSAYGTLNVLFRY